MSLIIDVHAHPPTRAYLERSGGAYLKAAAAYFGRTFPPITLDEMVKEYEAWGIGGAVLLGWDAERETGLPRLPNDDLIAAVRNHPSFFQGFAGIDPRRSTALEELERCAKAGLRGVKVHPTAQGFRPDDVAADRFWRRCDDAGLVAMIHTGTTGWGAGGEFDIRHEHSHPRFVDNLAARFSSLPIIAAHAGWPWCDELLAIAATKKSVHIDVSGWPPSQLPAQVWAAANGPLKHKVLFGSDYPFLDPGRMLPRIRELLSDDARPLVLGANAARLLRMG